jgi:hypothetical protein
MPESVERQRGRAAPSGADEEAERAGNGGVVALDQGEVVVSDIFAVGGIEPGFERGHAGGERVPAHEARIALHTVRDAVAVLAVTRAGELGDRNRKITEEGADERADVVFPKDGGEFGEFCGGRRHAGHGDDSPSSLARGAKQKDQGI